MPACDTVLRQSLPPRNLGLDSAWVLGRPPALNCGVVVAIRL